MVRIGSSLPEQFDDKSTRDFLGPFSRRASVSGSSALRLFTHSDTELYLQVKLICGSTGFN